MDIVRGNFGKCYICDCFDELFGIENESFENKYDLCITDPPYNVSYDKTNYQKKHAAEKFEREIIKTDIKYNDTIEDYPEFIRNFYEKIMNVSKTIVLTIGTPNIDLWRSIEKPRDVLYHYKRNGEGISACSWHNLIEPIYIYGEFKSNQRFHGNVFDFPLMNGFLRKNRPYILDHPHPKNKKLWFELIHTITKNIKNPHVLDPFMGSGTTAEVCEILGISWLGYEINESYVTDIKKRISYGIKQHNITSKKTKKLLEI